MNEDPGKLNLPPKEDSQPSPVVNIPKQPIISNFLLIPIAVLVLILLASTGYLAFQNYQLRRQISQLQTSPSPTSTPDPTANWKTITRKYWTFRVPKDWYYLECSDQALFVGPEYKADQTTLCDFEPWGTVVVNRAEVNYQIPTTKRDPETQEVLINIISQKETQVAGKPAVWQHEEISRGDTIVPMIRVYVRDKEATYIITLANLSQQELFSQILSTFKFTQ